ncbi:hypothetical protein L6452_03091 [Arctium lappa]|uniref:Uncharacterized protein n=1 Tax=Arctium lappa TaxID=4217 RepID=A0ACB9FLD7_ARCLA|nr:hypothetical protein L6452_03091 [Arctium lappa]
MLSRRPYHIPFTEGNNDPSERACKDSDEDDLGEALMTPTTAMPPEQQQKPPAQMEKRIQSVTMRNRRKNGRNRRK